MCWNDTPTICEHDGNDTPTTGERIRMNQVETSTQKIERLKKDAVDARERGDKLHEGQLNALIAELERRLREEGHE